VQEQVGACDLILIYDFILANESIGGQARGSADDLARGRGAIPKRRADLGGHARRHPRRQGGGADPHRLRPLDRDSNRPRFRGHINPTIARALENQGVASLRHDTRGAGKNGGDHYEAGLTENDHDACAAIDWLATRAPDLPTHAVGHSEGAPHVAHLAANDKVAGAELIASPARTGGEILTWQAAQIVPTLPPATKATLQLLHIDPLREPTQGLRAPPLDISRRRPNSRKEGERPLAPPVHGLRPRPDPQTHPRPRPHRDRRHDRQVPPEDVDTIWTLIAGPCDLKVIAGLSHILRPDPESKGPCAYRKALKEPISPTLLNAITEWIEKQINQPVTDQPETRARGHE
jgi:uncharacterized protein